MGQLCLDQLLPRQVILWVEERPSLAPKPLGSSGGFCPPVPVVQIHLGFWSPPPRTSVSLMLSCQIGSRLPGAQKQLVETLSPPRASAPSAGYRFPQRARGGALR